MSAYSTEMPSILCAKDQQEEGLTRTCLKLPSLYQAVAYWRPDKGTVAPFFDNL